MTLTATTEFLLEKQKLMPRVCFETQGLNVWYRRAPLRSKTPLISSDTHPEE